MCRYDYDERFVCAECFGDDGVRGFIEGNLESKVCSFCGTVAEEEIAAPFKAVAKHINESLYQEYDDAANGMSYVSAEGGYLGQTWTTWELLDDEIGLELPKDDDGTLIKALIDRLDDNAWCQRHPYSLTHVQETEFSWKHSARWSSTSDGISSGTETSVTVRSCHRASCSKRFSTMPRRSD